MMMKMIMDDDGDNNDYKGSDDYDDRSLYIDGYCTLYQWY